MRGRLGARTHKGNRFGADFVIAQRWQARAKAIVTAAMHTPSHIAFAGLGVMGEAWAAELISIIFAAGPVDAICRFCLAAPASALITRLLRRIPNEG